MRHGLTVRALCALEELESRCVLHANPVMDAEHAAVFALVPDSAATNVAVHSGRWDDAATWDSRGIPAAGANAIIAAGVNVALDKVHREALHTLRVDGLLHFATDVNTGLTVDAMIVSGSGTLEMGTAADPEHVGVEAKIRIANDGKAIDTVWDPNQFSRGLITHGVVSIHGANKTSFVGIAGAGAIKGATSMTLSQVPEGWMPGDRLVLTGTSPNPDNKQDEELKLLSIQGKVVTFQRQDATGRAFNNLAFNHLAPEGMSVYVANMSRNVAIESASVAQTQFRGHVMFMHNPSVDVEYAGFYGLGRTDKRNGLANPLFDANGKLVPGSGLNPAGRYAVHFHRTGAEPGDAQALILGSAVVDSPGWGFVNHSSNVAMKDNVSFNVVGAHFVSEAGDEIGVFDHNLAIRSTGSGDGIESRQNRQDFGHQGDGFWFQGAGLTVTNNIAASQRHSGFVFFTRGLDQKGLGVAHFEAGNLPDAIRSYFRNAEDVAVGSVPIFAFTNNTAFASGDGFESWFHLLDAPKGISDVNDGLRIWNTRGTGLFTPYTNAMTIRNAIVIGNTANPSGTGISRNDVTKNIIYTNDRIEGFNVGISAPVNGVNAIHGGALTNVINIDITTAASRDRMVTIDGAIQLNAPTAKALGTRTAYNLFLHGNFDPKKHDITTLFNPDVIRLGTVQYQGKQVYYLEQNASFVPFPVVPDGTTPPYDPQIPAQLRGLTNQQLFDKYGLAIGGIVAPADAVKDAKINGLIGAPATYLLDVTLVSAKYTNNMTGYKLSYKITGVASTVRETTPLSLQAGWNVVSRTIAGHVRTFLIYADVTPPTFTLASKIVLAINPADLKDGIYIEGQVTDNSTGSEMFRQRFSNLDRLPVQTKTDANGATIRYVRLTFTIKDRAGNATIVNLDVVIDPTAPLQQQIGLKDLPAVPASQTLIYLLGFLEDRQGTA
jgi:hypothetical protein